MIKVRYIFDTYTVLWSTFYEGHFIKVPCTSTFIAGNIMARERDSGLNAYMWTGNWNGIMSEC